MSDDALARLSHLVRERRASLSALARSEGVTPEDAVDCVQEAFCTVLDGARRRPLPEASDELSALLATVVRNAARNRRRRHFLARPHAPLDDASFAASAASPTEPTDAVIARAEDHVRLRACVQELCEIQRAVVTLRMLEEQEGDDVARALGISPGHVAVLLHRAKSALRTCMLCPTKLAARAR